MGQEESGGAGHRRGGGTAQLFKEAGDELRAGQEQALGDPLDDKQPVPTLCTEGVIWGVTGL